MQNKPVTSTWPLVVTQTTDLNMGSYRSTDHRHHHGLRLYHGPQTLTWSPPVTDHTPSQGCQINTVWATDTSMYRKWTSLHFGHHVIAQRNNVAEQHDVWGRACASCRPEAMLMSLIYTASRDHVEVCGSCITRGCEDFHGLFCCRRPC